MLQLFSFACGGNWIDRGHTRPRAEQLHHRVIGTHLGGRTIETAAVFLEDRIVLRRGSVSNASCEMIATPERSWWSIWAAPIKVTDLIEDRWFWVALAARRAMGAP